MIKKTTQTAFNPLFSLSAWPQRLTSQCSQHNLRCDRAHMTDFNTVLHKLASAGSWPASRCESYSRCRWHIYFSFTALVISNYMHVMPLAVGAWAGRAGARSDRGGAGGWVAAGMESRWGLEWKKKKKKGLGFHSHMCYHTQVLYPPHKCIYVCMLTKCQDASGFTLRKEGGLISAHWHVLL